MPKDKSLRAAVANEYSDVDDDFDQDYYDYDEDEVEEGYIPGSSVESDASDDGDLLTKAKRRRKSRREWGKIPDDKLPRVAIVGRPNVGKSALFNRLTGTKRAIVYDQPGITRDRMYVRAFWGDVEFMMVDTGGLESLPGSPQDAPSVNTVGGVEILPGMVESQAALAVREASALVFVVDGQKGLTSADEEIFGWIRKFHSATPLMLAVNKCESTTKGEEQILDFWSLGGVEPLAVSAISGTGTGELMDGLVAGRSPPPTTSTPADADFSEDGPAQDRHRRSPERGQELAEPARRGRARHRERLLRNHPRYHRLRRHGRGREQVHAHRHRRDPAPHVRCCREGRPEELSVGALQAMRRADIVVLVVDAEEGPDAARFRARGARGDAGGVRPGALRQQVGQNRQGLVHDERVHQDAALEAARVRVGVGGVHVGVHGQRMQKVLQAANEASVHHRKRLTTATLNAVVQEASCGSRPRARAGARARSTTSRKPRRGRRRSCFS